MQQNPKRTPRGKGIPMPGLRQTRYRRGLSIRDLSEKSGVKNTTISELENERRGAQARTLRSLAKALGVEPEELVG